MVFIVEGSAGVATQAFHSPSGSPYGDWTPSVSESSPRGRGRGWESGEGVLGVHGRGHGDGGRGGGGVDGDGEDGDAGDDADFAPLRVVHTAEWKPVVRGADGMCACTAHRPRAFQGASSPGYLGRRGARIYRPF